MKSDRKLIVDKKHIRCRCAVFPTYHLSMQQYWSRICKASVCLIASLEQNCIIELNHTPGGKLWHSSYCMDMHDVATGSTYSTEIFEAGINKINICKGLCADKEALHSSFIVLICQDYPIPQEKDIISPIFKPLESQGLIQPL